LSRIRIPSLHRHLRGGAGFGFWRSRRREADRPVGERRAFRLARARRRVRGPVRTIWNSSAHRSEFRSGDV